MACRDITGELSAGDRINESALATRFNTSRGPIREACRSLEPAGLVQRGNLHTSNAEHRHILEALRQRDATAAAERLSEHVMAGIRCNFGTMTKPLHVGRVSENGVTADPEVLDGSWGFMAVHGGSGASVFISTAL